MAYAALLSGIVLAQAGLGSVHGLASPLGAYFPIPHGTACGTLVAEAVAINLVALRERSPESDVIKKYGKAAELLCGRHFADCDEAVDALYALLSRLTSQLDIPRLGAFGVHIEDVDRLVANARGKQHANQPDTPDRQRNCGVDQKAAVTPAHRFIISASTLCSDSRACVTRALSSAERFWLSLNFTSIEVTLSLKPTMASSIACG